MSAGPWVVYNLAENSLGLAGIDFSSGTYKIALFTSTSNAGTASLSPATFVTLTNEVAAALGYTPGGATVVVTWTNVAGTETLGSANAQWTPGGITARFAVLYNSTTGKLIAYSLLDTTPADVQVTTITISASGVFQMARAA
jgi:hypothetical protein